MPETTEDERVPDELFVGDRCEDDVLTVRTPDRDYCGDTVLLQEDTVLVMGPGNSETVPQNRVRGIIRGTPELPRTGGSE